MGKWFKNLKGFGSIEVPSLTTVELVQNPCYQDSCPVPGHHHAEVQLGDLEISLKLVSLGLGSAHNA